MSKQFWLESGERCGINRVHRLMRLSGSRAQVGYRWPRQSGGEPYVVTPNKLRRQFNLTEPNTAWVTDIIRIQVGWLYLAIVVDLYSRKVVGRSMQSRITKELVLNTLLMAVWLRNPSYTVMVHCSHYTSHDWSAFLNMHGLEGSMSRSGNCHDNTFAESFFLLLKRERIRRKIYTNRDEARQDVFDYIEMFYNTKRRHGFNNQLSPVEFESRFSKRLIKYLKN